MSEPTEKPPSPQPTGLDRLGAALPRQRLPSGTGEDDLFRASIAQTRARVLAEALVLLMLGFTADDLELLRVPGFLVGAVLALLHMSLGGLWHGSRLRDAVADLPHDLIEDRFRSYRARSRMAAVATVVVLVVWLALFSLGVPPWAL